MVNGKKYFVILAAITAIIFIASMASALELPKEIKSYHKDRVLSTPGASEGVGPTQKGVVQEGVDIGRREAKEYDFTDESSAALTIKAWDALNKKDEGSILAYTSRCMELYEENAKNQQQSMSGFAPSGAEKNYQHLNDIAACYFIQAEFYKYKRQWQESRAAYQKIVDEFSFAQYWDPRGWWWKPAEISKDEVKKIDSGYYEKK